MDIKFDGLDEVQKKLSDLNQRARELDGEHTVSLVELFPTEFIREHTSLGTIQELMEESGFDIKTQEAFKAIPADEWNNYIRKVTNFSDWQEMMSEATKEYTLRKLGL